MIKAGVAALVLVVYAAPLRADPAPDQHLAGERIGGRSHDYRVSKRLDTRLPTRLETRVEPRSTLDPLAKAKSVITADPTNGCTPAGQAGTSPACPPR